MPSLRELMVLLAMSMVARMGYVLVTGESPGFGAVVGLSLVTAIIFLVAKDKLTSSEG